MTDHLAEIKSSLRDSCYLSRVEANWLIDEVDRLRQRLLSAAGDDLCRLSQEEIKQMSAGAVKIPPKEEFLASCERFHTQIASESGVMTNCLTLAQLVAENERLRPDAERWQHVRKHGLVDAYSPLGISMSKVANYVMYDEAADQAIDAARKQ